MKKFLSFIFLTSLVSVLSAQSISIIGLNVKRNDIPSSYKNIYLFDGADKISWSFTDEDGKCSFIIDPIPHNTDSIYISIKEENSSSSRIYLDELNLLRRNDFEGYAIRIIDLKLFNKDEYEKYIRENKFIPKRKKNLAKDID
jgi:hypothetical protein